ncbi:MAG: metalloregulator ArsR/SmtB family transcription factor [Gemmatimonadales bacterium]|nr:metalloregulator ArsR/SmtB family transcription factor [Gemmatimonadales bacterium]
MTAPAIFGRLSGLADPIRGRVLLALERQELTVRELQAVLRLPQSTVSRHLKVLADLGLVITRGEGTSNWYRMPARDLDPSARRLWSAVREEVAGSSAALRDGDRLQRVLAERHVTSQRFFASAAGQWDHLRGELFGHRAALVALLALLDESWTVGDLGCGTGQVSATLAPFVHRVIAVDESAAMLKAARQRTRDLPSVDIRSGTLEALPVAEGELDAALLILTLHHAADPARVLASARRALKPGGKLLVVDMLPHDRAEYREQMGHQWLGFAEDQIQGWLTEAGFCAARLTALPADTNARGPGLFVLTAKSE